MSVDEEHNPNPASDGSPQFVALLTDHQSDLRAFIISQMPSHPDVTDVLQKTNIILWNKRDSFTLGSNFRAWSMQVARFEVMKHLRSLKNNQCFVFDEEVLNSLAEDAPNMLPASPSRLDALQNCLGKLKKKDRALIEHRYAKSGSLEDFAAMTGRTASSLSVALFRLRAALRKCISHDLRARGGVQ